MDFVYFYFNKFYFISGKKKKKKTEKELSLLFLHKPTYYSCGSIALKLIISIEN